MSVYTVGSNKSSDSIFPKIRPSLDLDFANSKTLDPRITFTRSSGGSYVGADGLIKYAGVNEARFDHNPVTGESLGLLIEEPRTNLLTYSDDAQTAWSIKSGLTLSSNVDVSPDGNTTADALIEDTLRNDKYLERQITVNANQNITWSCFVKPSRRTNIFLRVYDGASYSNNIAFIYEYSNKTVFFAGAFGTGTLGNYGVIDVGNGWYRMYVSGQPTTSASSSVRVRIGFINQSSTYTGTGVLAGYVWGAQLEVGAFPTSYIPTQSSTVTRAADNAQITGTNFSSWYNSSEGTIVISTDKLYSGNFDSFRHYYQIGDFTATNTFGTMYTNSGSQVVTNYGTTNAGRQVFDYQQIDIGSAPTQFKIGQSINSKYSFFTSSKGTTPAQSPSKLIPNISTPTSVDRLWIGRKVSVGGEINSHIARLTYYPKALPISQLQALTR